MIFSSILRSALLLTVVVCFSFQGHGQSQLMQKKPNVLVTIKPMYHLVERLMDGVAKPVLLLDETADPHHFTMHPSHVQKVQDADMIIWVGPTLEYFLVKPLIKAQKKTLTLIGIKGLELLNRDRDEGCLLKEACVTDKTLVQKKNEIDALYETEVTALDPHIWLDIDNVVLMVKEIAFYLSAQDLSHAHIYQENAKVLRKELVALKAELMEKAKPLAGFHFIAFHDAYGYLERKFSMENSAKEVISLSKKGMSMGLKSFAAIKDIIQKRGVGAIFVDPQHPSKIEEKIATDFKISMVESDPLGLETKAGPHHYADMMHALLDQFKNAKEATSEGQKAVVPLSTPKGKAKPKKHVHKSPAADHKDEKKPPQKTSTKEPRSFPGSHLRSPSNQVIYNFENGHKHPQVEKQKKLKAQQERERLAAIEAKKKAAESKKVEKPLSPKELKAVMKVGLKHAIQNANNKRNEHVIPDNRFVAPAESLLR